MAQRKDDEIKKVCEILSELRRIRLRRITSAWRSPETFWEEVVTLNDIDECFRWLEYAVENREVFFGWFRRFQLLENVRRDARFAALLKKVGLPP